MTGRRVVMRLVLLVGASVLGAGTAIAQPLFRTATTYGTGSVLDALPILIVADVGGPGDTPADSVPDLITAQQQGMVATVLIGSPDGTFSPAPPSPLGVVPTALAVGDFDKDGVLDLIASDDNESITFVRGNNDGTFGPPGPLVSAGPQPRALIAADINADHNLDLLVVNDPDSGTASVTVLLGNGDGTFQEPGLTIQTAAGSRAAALGDFNQDAKSDLAVANAGANSLSILRGNGTGQFAFAQPVDFGTMPVREPFAIAAADLNADTRPDLVVVNHNSDEVAVVDGRADHSFAMPQFFASGGMGSAPNGLALADINHDGKIDVMTSNNFSFDVSVLLGDGRGNLGRHRAFVADQEPLAIVAQDFNHDGIPDVATVNRGIQSSTASVAILLGKSDGSLAGVEDVATLQDPIGMAVGDVDNDGLPDLIVGHDGGEVLVYRAISGGGFAAAATLEADANIVAVGRGDFNGDGLLDIATASTSSTSVSTLSVFLARLTGGFGPAQKYPVGNGATALVTGDWNRDGRDDLAVTRQGSGSSGAVDVLLASSTGGFGSTVSLAVGQNPATLDVGDFNEDGKVDLVVGSSTDVSLLLGNGDGSFQLAKSITTPSTAGGVTGLIVADFDRDSHDDLAYSKPATAAVQLLYGDGKGGFVPFPGRNPPSVGVVSALAARDLNGDAFPDLLVADGPTNVVDAFFVETSVPSNLRRFRINAQVTVGRMPIRAAAADFDGDGRYDAATLTSSVASGVSVLTNIRTAPILRGDGNGDGAVSAADAVAVLRDVGVRRVRTRFEQVPVGGGTFPGAPGVDANGDGLVTPQDAAAVAHRIFAGV